MGVAGTRPVAFLAVGSGVCVGFLIRAVATRLFASLRYIHRGAAAFPQNWRRTLFQIDVRCVPELVPGIGEEEPLFRLGPLVKAYIFGTNIGDKIFGALLIPVLFIPSLLYRYSLKSTCWLYLPLIYVAHLPER